MTTTLQPFDMFHGTSAARLEEASATGLHPILKRRTFFNHDAVAWDSPTQRSLDGIYLAEDIDIALDYAEHAASLDKSMAAVVAIRVSPGELLLDEDSIPLHRLMMDTVQQVGLNRDSDGVAILRRLLGRPSTSRAARQAIGYLREELAWTIGCAEGVLPLALCHTALVVATERCLVHLSRNEALMELLGAQVRRLPFPVPAEAADVCHQENLYLETMDAISRAWAMDEKRRTSWPTGRLMRVVPANEFRLVDGHHPELSGRKRAA